jgi:hypothetical protein
VAEPAVETKPAKEEVAAKAAKEEPAKSPRKPGFGAYRGGAHTGGKEPRHTDSLLQDLSLEQTSALLTIVA